MSDPRWTVTLRFDTSGWSANREYPMTNVLPFGGTGHAWLTVAAPDGKRVDLGYYPMGNPVSSRGDLRAGDGVEKTGDVKHQPHQDAAYTYPISAGQAAKILSTAEQLQANPGTYNFYNHNCVTVARDLMVAGGVPMPPVERGADPSVPVWKTPYELPAAGLHDPAEYNTALKSTPVGQEARARYEKSSELSGWKTSGSLADLSRQARGQAAQEGGKAGQPAGAPTRQQPSQPMAPASPAKSSTPRAPSKPVTPISPPGRAPAPAPGGTPSPAPAHSRQSSAPVAPTASRPPHTPPPGQPPAQPPPATRPTGSSPPAPPPPAPPPPATPHGR
ncbi:MAG: hypothetical protein ACRDT6_09395 [Micromonosporaceae bacterium]